MKIRGNVNNLLVMTKKDTQGVKDPSKHYYKIGVVTDNDEIGELPTTEEVYNSVDRGHAYNFVYTFNSEYGSFMLDQVLPIEKK